MQIIYMFSGVDKEKGFSKEQGQYLKKDIKNNMSICFIASTFDNIDSNDIYFIKEIEFFKNIGISFKDEVLIDSRISKEYAKEIIKNSDIIFLMGGNPYLQMKSINEYGLKNIIKNKDGIIIGVSAGSINMATHVCYKDEKILEYDGIGLADINIYPHLENSSEYIKELYEVSALRSLTALPNDSFIRISDTLEYVNDYYLIQKRMNKKELTSLIEALKIDKEEFWVLSSSALVLRDLFPSAGDLDIAVTEEGLKQLKKSYNLKMKDNGWYTVNDKVECMLDTKEPWKVEKHEGYYLESLEKYFEYLKTSKRDKDKIKYEIVKNALNR